VQLTKSGMLGMTSVKPFGILVEARGEGVEDRRNCQNRKPKTLPLINTDNTDRKKAWRRPNPRQSGMTWDGVGYPGRGRGIAGIADIAVIARDRETRTLTTKDTKEHKDRVIG